MSKVRLNIYLLEPEIRRRVKMAAARQDISLSAYCYQAIVGKLGRENEGTGNNNGSSLSRAISKARRFLKGAFPGESFRVSSSTLIAQGRKERAKKP